MLVWPFMQQFFSQQEIPELNYASLEKEGSGAMIGLAGTENGSTDKMSSTMDSDQIDDIDESPLSMDWETMQRLSRAFFDTYNLLSPIMDRQVFYSESLPSLASNGFSESSTSTLACLVFALGEVALSAVQGNPVGSWEGRTSGVKGGSVEKPPGLSFFNEARKRSESPSDFPGEFLRLRRFYFVVVVFSLSTGAFCLGCFVPSNLSIEIGIHHWKIR